MPTKKPRLTFAVSQETLDRIDGFRAKSQEKNQSQAILSLLEKGLADAEKQSPARRPQEYSKAALQLARDYDSLDTWGRKALRALADAEMARCEDETRLQAEATPEPEPKVITLYRDPAAAGYLTGDTQSDGEPYVLGPTDPLGAEYAVIIQGDSMEPDFPDGSIVFVNHDQMRDGDIGIFCVDGKTVIKQWHYDRVLRITYLFSLNRARADADVVITSGSGRALVWQGRVLSPKSHPLPTL